MIGSIVGYLWKNVFTRKRKADEALVDEPPANRARLSDNHPLSEQQIIHAVMSSDVKENVAGEKSDDEVCIVDEIKSQSVSRRRSLRSGVLCTSTPRPSQSSGISREWSLPTMRTRRIVDAARVSSSSAERASDPEVQVIQTIRNIPIEHTGVVARKKQPLLESSAQRFMKFSRRHGSHSNSFQNQSRQAYEVQEYRKLLEAYQKRPSYLYSFTIPQIKAVEQPRKIDVVDLTADVQVSRKSEITPATAASRAADDDGMAADSKPVKRVNSLRDFLETHPITSSDLDVQILKRSETNLQGMRRSANLEETRLAVLTPHNQALINTALEDRMRLYMKITEPPVLEIEEEEEKEEAYFLPELTDEQETKVTKALKSSPPREIVADKFDLSITRHDMSTLKGHNWLNDEVINFYMNLLMERGKKEGHPKVYAFNTFFYPKLVSGGHPALKRWTRKVDLFAHDIICIPVHLGMHWCMAIVEFETKEIRYYDSMLAPNDRCLKAILEYLKAESLDKRKTAFDTGGWELRNVKGIPQQMNSCDCGVFACTFAEHISRNAPLLFTQDNMPYFRRKMVLEILEGALIT